VNRKFRCAASCGSLLRNFTIAAKNAAAAGIPQRRRIEKKDNKKKNNFRFGWFYQ